MSDLPPAERPTPPRARRATRPKPRSAAARRARKPAGPQTSADELTSTQEVATNPYEFAAAETTGAPVDPVSLLSLRGFTILSKQILLWASIVGVVSLALSFIPVVEGALGVTQADVNTNAGLQGLGCLTLLVSLALPFAGGWRATMREGNWKQGGMTGFWSAIIATILGLIVTVIYAAIIQKLDQLNGDYFSGLLQGLILQGLLSFALGAMGGTFSVWQRRRAQQQQEALTSSS